MRWPLNLLVALAFVIPVSALAIEEGEDMTRQDRTALLYATKFLFTKDHIPIVTVLVMEGENSIQFSSSAPMTFLPEGEGGPQITIGKGPVDCTATLEAGKPAKIRHWVALEQIAARNFDEVRKAQDLWANRGLKVRSFERGSVFGFFGRVLDNRTLTLVEDSPFDDPKAAQLHRTELAAKLGVPTLEDFEEVVERPNGLVRIKCQGQAADMLFPGMVAIATQADSITVHKVEFGKGFAWHGRENRQYRGQLIFTPDREGKLAAVNAVDAETMLKGLVPSEIYNDAPMEALKVQATCARSELFAKLGNRHSADPYMVCADVHCQVYKGKGRENPRTSKAVDDTRGQMVFTDNGLADAVYSSNCGGHTESGGLVWQGADHQYLAGVPDVPGGFVVYPEGVNEQSVAHFINNPPQAFCGSTKYGKGTYRWTKTVSTDKMRSGILEQAGVDVGEIKELKILERGVSGRITRLEVVGSKRSVVLQPELRIRKAFDGLRSSLFVHKLTSENGRPAYEFTGAGFGHGVGMCQVGAIGRAQHGQDFETILKHYYPGTVVTRIY